MPAISLKVGLEGVQPPRPGHSPARGLVASALSRPARRRSTSSWVEAKRCCCSEHRAAPQAEQQVVLGGDAASIGHRGRAMVWCCCCTRGHAGGQNQRYSSRRPRARAARGTRRATSSRRFADPLMRQQAFGRGQWFGSPAGHSANMVFLVQWASEARADGQGCDGVDNKLRATFAPARLPSKMNRRAPRSCRLARRRRDAFQRSRSSPLHSKARAAWHGRAWSARGA